MMSDISFMQKRSDYSYEFVHSHLVLDSLVTLVYLSLGFEEASG